MINEYTVKNYCCEDISNIENYEKAINSSETWDCHHRLETHNSDGEKRAVDISQSELKALGMYFNRPADELIFLTHKDHQGLHHKGKKRSKETKRRISEVEKGRTFSEEWKAKLSASHKGKHHSEEERRKISEALKGRSSPTKGKRWKLVYGKRVYY